MITLVSNIALIIILLVNIKVNLANNKLLREWHNSLDLEDSPSYITVQGSDNIDSLLDNKYGEKGTPSREAFQREFENAFQNRQP